MRGWHGLAAVVLALFLSGCGGGGTPTGADAEAAVAGCGVADRRAWLGEQFRQTYLWNGLTPAVDAAEDRTWEAYFRDSLFRGNEFLPADRYSYFESSQAFAQYYELGQTLGYGLAVAGQEVLGRPDAPLWIRDVTPASPASNVGLARGDRVVSLNGLAASEVIRRADFSALTPMASGDVLEIAVERQGQTLTRKVVAGVHGVLPIRHGRVFTLPDGQRVGLIRINAMINSLDQDMAVLFARFRSQAVSAIILDLRYNGGGAVSVGRDIASMTAGRSADGKVYALLKHNREQQRLNESFRFLDPTEWDGVRKVYVLAGRRTCSASEQVIAGLRGVGVDVVVVGSTTCGKPVGFRPRDHCGHTFSMVTFESVNALDQGGYYTGFQPQCAVAEDFTMAMEDPQEPLTAAALQHAQGLGCPVASTLRQTSGFPTPRLPAWVDGPDGRVGMIR